MAPALLLAVALGVLPALVRAVYYPDYPGTDDSFIHAAIIRNLQSGQGWGINPDEPVNLSTSPLFTLVMLAVATISGDPIVAGSVLTTLAVVCGIVMTFVLAARMSGRASIGLVAAAIAAANVHLWRWTGAFIEAPLAFAGVLAVLLAFDRLYLGTVARVQAGRFVALGCAIGVLSLLRFECGLLGLGFFAHHLVNDRRFLVRRYASAAIGLAMPLALWAGYAWLTFGHVLPTTLGAKTTGGFILVNAELLRLYAGTLGSGFLAAFVLLAVALTVLSASGARVALAAAGRQCVLFAVFAGAMLAFYYLKTESLQSPARYLLPAMAALPLAITPFVAAAWERSERPMRFAAIGLVSLQLLGAAGVNHFRVAPVLARMNDGYVAAMSEAAAELDRRCESDDVVLVEIDIGVLSHRLGRRCRIADGGALASPALRGLTLAQKIAVVRPRFIVESLGSPARSAVDIPAATLLWSREFPSHSVGEPQHVFTVRLFELR